MQPPVRVTRVTVADLGRLGAFVVLITCLAACGKAPNTATAVPGQRTFASPDQAGAVVLEAAKAADQDGLLAIFGPDARQILFSGDAVKDQENLRDFVAAYTQMHRWREIKAGGEMLYIGADNYLFPIPLDKNASGAWQFDTAAGKDEILARRIGKGELSAIAACDALVRAQAEYFSRTHDGDTVKQYARKLVSTEGKHDGLYWPDAPGQPPSPLSGISEFAKAADYSHANARPFNGYYFRLLTKQGSGAKGGVQDYVVNGEMTRGFAFLAFPAEYRNSGIMTFIVGTDGAVYQKDLGEKTSTTADAVTEYNPADGWNPAL